MPLDSMYTVGYENWSCPVQPPCAETLREILDGSLESARSPGHSSQEDNEDLFDLQIS